MLFESGYPRESIRASWCNTGNEAPQTVEYVQYLRDRLEIEIEEIHPEWDFFELAKKKKRFPSARARFCTEYLKIIPTNKHVKALLEEFDGDVLLHTGIRQGESLQRSRQTEEYVHDPYFDCDVRRPLLTWALKDVWDIHERYGVKRNPLYEQGMTRVGCYPCVLCAKQEIGNIALHDPERIDFIEKMEAEVGEVSARGSATMFSPDTIPLRFRSKPWTNPKTGEVVYLSTIRDVAAWGKTSAELYHLSSEGELFPDHENEEVEARFCPSTLGLCE